jgi:ABC-type spermidine/putrescine transport system permease subunit I
MVRSRSQDRAVSAKHFKGWQAALAVALMILASAAPVAWIESRPRDGSEVAVIFAPWMTSEDAFARVLAADGLVMRQGIIESILVVHGVDSGLINRLYAVGAWAVIDPVAFGGCLVKSRSRTV